MKILIIKNRLTVEVQDDVLKAFTWLTAKTPLTFDISYLTTNIDLNYKLFPTPNQFYGTTGTKDKLLPLIKDKYDVVIFMYGNSPNGLTPDGHQLTAWTFWEGINGMEYIEIPCYPLADNTGWIGRTIQHEMMHHFCKLLNGLGGKVVDKMDTYIENENPDSPTGNYAQTFATLNLYWKLLNKPMYKYFKDSEIVGLKPELVKLLDKAREIAGVPFKITSGFRTPEQNKKVGGVQDSAHETGLAVDLLVKDSVSGGKILLSLAQVGIKRFGFYGDGHIHCDIDYTKPNPCYWIK